MRKSVMKRAWQIANQGCLFFGGKASQYIAGAMKMAWAEIKAAADKVEIVLSPGSKRHKSWLAKVVGRHPRFKFDRKFLESESDEDKIYNVKNGVYEACDGGDRYFIQVENGAYEVIQDWKVEELIA